MLRLLISLVCLHLSAYSMPTPSGRNSREYDGYPPERSHHHQSGRPQSNREYAVPGDGGELSGLSGTSSYKRNFGPYEGAHSYRENTVPSNGSQKNLRNHRSFGGSQTNAPLRASIRNVADLEQSLAISQDLGHHQSRRSSKSGGPGRSLSCNNEGSSWLGPLKGPFRDDDAFSKLGGGCASVDRNKSFAGGVGWSQTEKDDQLIIRALNRKYEELDKHEAFESLDSLPISRSNFKSGMRDSLEIVQDAINRDLDFCDLKLPPGYWGQGNKFAFDIIGPGGEQFRQERVVVKSDVKSDGSQELLAFHFYQEYKRIDENNKPTNFLTSRVRFGRIPGIHTEEPGDLEVSIPTRDMDGAYYGERGIENSGISGASRSIGSRGMHGGCSSYGNHRPRDFEHSGGYGDMLVPVYSDRGERSGGYGHQMIVPLGTEQTGRDLFRALPSEQSVGNGRMFIPVESSRSMHRSESSKSRRDRDIRPVRGVQYGSHESQSGSHRSQSGSHRPQSGSHRPQTGSHGSQSGTHGGFSIPKKVTTPLKSSNSRRSLTPWMENQHSESEVSVYPQPGESVSISRHAKAPQYNLPSSKQQSYGNNKENSGSVSSVRKPKNLTSWKENQLPGDDVSINSKPEKSVATSKLHKSVKFTLPENSQQSSGNKENAASVGSGRSSKKPPRSSRSSGGAFSEHNNLYPRTHLR